MAEVVAVFARGGRRFALPVVVVERIVRAVALEAWPEGSRGVVGAVNVHGEHLPVFDFRCWLGAGVAAPPAEDEYLILVRTGRQRAAIVASEVPEVGALETASVGQASADGLPGTRLVADGLMFIHDLDRLLCHAGRLPGAAALWGEGGNET